MEHPVNLSRIAELTALYEECGDNETAGRLAYANGKSAWDNPAWEAGLYHNEQSYDAVLWLDGWEQEEARDRKLGRAA